MKIPCAIYRGGTTKPVFFLERDLPEDRAATARLLMEGHVYLPGRFAA